MWGWLADRIVPAYAVHWCGDRGPICAGGFCCVHWCGR